MHQEHETLLSALVVKTINTQILLAVACVKKQATAFLCLRWITKWLRFNGYFTIQRYPKFAVGANLG